MTFNLLQMLGSSIISTLVSVVLSLLQCDLGICYPYNTLRCPKGTEQNKRSMSRGNVQKMLPREVNIDKTKCLLR